MLEGVNREGFSEVRLKPHGMRFRGAVSRFKFRELSGERALAGDTDLPVCS